MYSAASLLCLGLLEVRGRLDLLAADPGSWLGARGLCGVAAGDLGLGLLLGLALVLLTERLPEDMVWSRHLRDRIRQVLRGIQPRHALLLALASGVGEELLFRGVLLDALRGPLGWPAALGASSLLFGLAHLGSDRRLLGWAGFSLAVGVLLGGLFLITGSLLAPVAAHATVNGLNLLHEVWTERLFGDDPPGPARVLEAPRGQG